MKQSSTESNLEHRVFPVILPVPLKDRKLKGRERVKTLSRLARQALEISAVKCRLRIGELIKDDHGVPLPFDGHYWSLTHKPKYVGAVISLQKTGIDIEIYDVNDLVQLSMGKKYKDWVGSALKDAFRINLSYAFPM